MDSYDFFDDIYLDSIFSKFIQNNITYFNELNNINNNCYLFDSDNENIQKYSINTDCMSISVDKNIYNQHCNFITFNDLILNLNEKNNINYINICVSESNKITINKLNTLFECLNNCVYFTCKIDFHIGNLQYAKIKVKGKKLKHLKISYSSCSISLDLSKLNNIILSIIIDENESYNTNLKYPPNSLKYFMNNSKNKRRFRKKCYNKYYTFSNLSNSIIFLIVTGAYIKVPYNTKYLKIYSAEFIKNKKKLNTKIFSTMNIGNNIIKFNNLKVIHLPRFHMKDSRYFSQMSYDTLSINISENVEYNVNENIKNVIINNYYCSNYLIGTIIKLPEKLNMLVINIGNALIKLSDIKKYPKFINFLEFMQSDSSSFKDHNDVVNEILSKSHVKLCSLKKSHHNINISRFPLTTFIDNKNKIYISNSSGIHDIYDYSDELVAGVIISLSILDNICK